MSSTLERLKERKLVQWALAYLAGAWLLLQVADTLGDNFAWPRVIFQSLTVLLAVGFLAALVLAWYHGEKGQQRVSGPELLMLSALLVIAGAAVTFIGSSESSEGQPAAIASTAPVAEEARSIAVLPFENLSSDPENEYFSDGITEDILTHLSKIGNLRVISRTSVMRYKSTDKSLQQIANELGVAHVLEGSVRRAGDRVRIVAQLIDARSDQHLWAETYDRDLKDIFAIQSEIAQKIAAALQAELSPAERRRIEAQPTENLTAYDFYLRGRDYYNRYRKEQNEIAIELFKKAIRLDSTFALAYAGLGDAYALNVARYGLASEWGDSAIAAAEKGMSLDPDLAEAHKALGTAYLSRGWYRRAVRALESAIALNPNYGQAIHNLGLVRFRMGEPDEALRWYLKSIRVNPVLAALTLGRMSEAYIVLGAFSEAEEAIRKALALQPDLVSALTDAVTLSLTKAEHAQAEQQSQKIVPRYGDDVGAWIAAGDVPLFARSYEQARHHYERAYALSRTASSWGRYIPVLLGYTLWKTGERERAQRLFEEYRAFARNEMERGNESWALKYSLAAVHAIRGEKPEAYRWLQKAQSSGWTEYYFSRQDPLLENLQGDAEFQRILAQQKTRINRIRQGVERDGI